MSRRRVALGVGANAIDRVAMVLVQLLLVPLLASHWGLERFGGWAMLITVPTLLSLSDLGFASAATARMTMEVARGERSAARTTMCSAAQVVTLACLVILILAVILALLLPDYLIFQVPQTSVPATRQTITFLTFYACLVIISTLILGLFRSNQKFALGAILSTATTLAENSILVFVVLKGYGIDAGAGALVCGRLFGLLMMFYVAKRLNTGMYPSLRGGSNQTRQELLRPSLAAMAIPLASALLLQGTVVALGLSAGAALVPAFVAARTLSRFGLQAAQIIITPLMPEFGAASAQGNHRQTVSLVILATCSASLIAVPYAALLGLAGPWIIQIWSNGTIHASSGLLLAMAVSSMCGGIWNPLSNLMLAVNRQSEFAYVYAVFSALAVVLTFTLGASSGSIAAALSLALVDFAMLIVVARFVSNTWVEPGSMRLAWQDFLRSVGRLAGKR